MYIMNSNWFQNLHVASMVKSKELCYYAHLENFNLNFSRSSFVILSASIFSILNHPCSFMIYYYDLFGVFLS